MFTTNKTSVGFGVYVYVYICSHTKLQNSQGWKGPCVYIFVNVYTHIFTQVFIYLKRLPCQQMQTCDICCTSVGQMQITQNALNTSASGKCQEQSKWVQSFKFRCSELRFWSTSKIQTCQEKRICVWICYYGDLSLWLDVAGVLFRSNICNEQFVHPKGKGENLLSASEYKGMLCWLPASGQSVISFQSAYFCTVLLS